jgi:hypothetical protein
MRKLKISAAVLSLVTIVIFTPSPLTGFYLNPIGCACLNTKYCKVDDNRFCLMYCGHETGDWIGNARQVGTGRYVIDLGGDLHAQVMSFPLFIIADGQILPRLPPTSDILFTEKQRNHNKNGIG